MNSKYELIDKTIIAPSGATLHQIRALVDIGTCVVAGDLGGFIESEDHLSISGNCWVFDNAWVSGDARVSGNAQVSDNARVSGNALVYGDAQVSDNARVSGIAWVCGNAWVSGL